MAEIETSGTNEQPEQEAPQAPVEQTNIIDWQAIAHDPQFEALLQQKRRVIIPLTILFIVYYFGFLILVGYVPALVETSVIGQINIAYLFALSQFILAWVIVYLYVRQAKTFDQLSQRIIAKVKGEQG